MKVVETLNNTVKLITGILNLALIGGIVFGCLWVYRQITILTSKPIQMPSIQLPTVKLPEKIELPKIEPPQINIKAPTIDLSGLMGKKAESAAVEQAIDKGWATWKEKNEVALSNPAYRNLVGQWQSGVDGSTLAGFESLNPPDVAIVRDAEGQPRQVVDHHYYWIGAKPTKMPADVAERVKAGQRPGRWFNSYDRTYVLGFEDTRPDEKVTRTRADGSQFTESYAWYWLNQGEITPPPAVPKMELAYRCNHNGECRLGKDSWECIARTEYEKCTHKSPCKSLNEYRATHEEELYRRCAHEPKCVDKLTHLKEYHLDIVFPPEYVKAAKEDLKKQGLWKGGK